MFDASGRALTHAQLLGKFQVGDIDLELGQQVESEKPGLERQLSVGENSANTGTRLVTAAPALEHLAPIAGKIRELQRSHRGQTNPCGQRACKSASWQAWWFGNRSRES